MKSPLLTSNALDHRMLWTIKQFRPEAEGVLEDAIQLLLAAENSPPPAAFQVVGKESTGCCIAWDRPADPH